MNSAASPDAFQLLPEAQKTGSAEDALFDAQVAEIEAWWKTPRYDGIKRPYSAVDVATKRGTQQVVYPSSVMAKKLFDLVKERGSKGEPIHTSTYIWHTVHKYRVRMLTMRKKQQWVRLIPSK